MPLILIVEDDARIIEAIQKTLTLDSACRSEVVMDPAKALPSAIRVKPDLILLDIRLPGGDGRQILRELKANAATQTIPVIFLTGLGSEADKVLGLDFGADDYLVKPFGAMELLARIRAVLRRYQPGPSGGNILEIAGMRLEPSERRVSLDGEELRLRPREFEILYLLASHAGKTLTRSYLIENSSSYGMPLPTRSLDTHIKNIRKKLGAARAGLIETVPKLGYRFSPLDERA
ncbi:MAG: response regulator transcription factor [Elusimicrobiota bacterium]